MIRHTLIATTALLLTTYSWAYDPQDLRRLLDSGACHGCDLRGASLQNRQLPGADLREARLQKADLRGADLKGAQLSGARLDDALLAGADLRGAVLNGASLLGTALEDVRLTGADLRNADLSHLEIDEAFEFVELVGVQLQGARFRGGVRCGPLPAKGGWGCEALLPKEQRPGSGGE